MKFSRLSAVFLGALLLATFLLPTAASAHSTSTAIHAQSATTHKQGITTTCPYVVKSVLNTSVAVVAFANDCLVQDLGTISPAALTTLLANAGVILPSTLANLMILDRGVIQAVDFSCLRGGVDVGYSPILPNTFVSVTCP